MKFITCVKIYVIFSLIICNNTLGVENKILLKINNEIITTVDILNEIKFLSTLNKEFKNIEKNQQIQIAKNSLVKDKIKTIELLKFKENIDLEQNDFEKIIKNYHKNLNIENFENIELFFKINNLDMSHVKKKISIDTFWKGMIFQKFNEKVRIDETQIKENLFQKEKQIEYMLSEILFIVDKNENLEKKLLDINKMIKEKSFSEAALNYSVSDTAQNGGKLGWIKENILNENIINELRQIKLNEYTKPIVIPGGFLILNKENTREIKINIDRDKEIKLIIQKKTNDQLEKFSNIYLNKLKKNIQINEI